jgi:hypothetical protein
MGSERSMKSKINIVQTSESYMYTVKSKALGYELAEDWMLFWTFFMPIILIISAFSKENTLIYKGILYLIPIFAITIIRRNITSSFKYLLANVFIVFLIFMISFTLLEKVIYGGGAILYFFISLRKRNKEIVEFYKISMLLLMEIIMLICYIIATNYNLTVQKNLINFTSINIAITCAIYIYISRISRLKEWEGEFIKDYSHRMRKINLTCIAFISGTILFFLLIAWRIGLFELFDMLTNRILDFFNATHSYAIKPIKNKPVINKATPDLGDGLKNLHPSGKSSNFLTILFKIIYFIFFLALFLGLIYFLFHLLIIIRNFYRGLRLKKTYKREESKFELSLMDMKKEIIKKTDKFKVSFMLPFNMSNSKKIRRLYYKLIKAYKIKGLSVYDFNTPVEIEGKVKEVLDKNINIVTQIYEKARYSKEVCSKEDVDKMKTFS